MLAPDRGGEAEDAGSWMLDEINRLFAAWQAFESGEIDRTTLSRKLVSIQAGLGITIADAK